MLLTVGRHFGPKVSQFTNLFAAAVIILRKAVSTGETYVSSRRGNFK